MRCEVQELSNMDLSVLEALRQIKQERDTIEQRLVQMEARKTEVAPPIYLRVRADYETQKQKLLADEAPLKKKAATLYASVRSQLDHVERRSEESKLALQELQFRHSLGEFTEAEFAEREKKIKADIKSQVHAHNEADLLRARFIDAFDSEAALELAAPVVPEALPSRAPPLPAATLMAAPAQLPPVYIAPAPPTPVPGSGPVLGPPSGPPNLPPAGKMPSPPPLPIDDLPPAAAPQGKRGNPDATMMFRPGRLNPQNAEAGSVQVTISLKPMVIGTDASCDVRVNSAGVADKQAEISLSRSGFMLRNIAEAAGNNAVLLNQVPVSEHMLKDGDVIHVGVAHFVFKIA
jgi:hypothetical protein